MKCKNLKIKSQKGIKKGYCKLHNKEVSVFCNKCSFEIKYDTEKLNKSKTKNKINKPIKQRSSKLCKAEKNRFSIIYQDLTKCCVEGCITPHYRVQKNEVFDGSYRQASIRYGLVCPFCENCHKRFHKDREFALFYKRLFQDKFIELYSRKLFMSVFKMDYHYRK